MTLDLARFAESNGYAFDKDRAAAYHFRDFVIKAFNEDIWDDFKDRFGVQRICEIYGASEGNVVFLNLLNKNRTIGAAAQSIALVQYDTQSDEIVRDKNGRCVEVGVGEPGLLLSEITAKTEFEGYTNAEATAKKIVENVFKQGDRWFNTGDLVRQIDVGFALGLKHFQFVDRTGDTFRWRSENVSTNEVAEVMNTHPQISMANVYGVAVPGVEGKAGMLAFELPEGEELDLDSFQALVEIKPVGTDPQGVVKSVVKYPVRNPDVPGDIFRCQVLL